LDKGAVMAYESCDALRQKGLAVSGDAAAADRFAAASAKRILSERTLGGHKEIVLFGTPTEREREEAARMGLSLSRPALQDLFIHMTEGDSIDERDESDENDA
jgi:ABC-2 type transport system ATP-binding protein